MKHLLSYDPLNGLASWFEPDGDKFKIGHTQDVSKDLAYSKRLQNDPEYKRQGIKNDWMHFAHVPAIAMMQIQDKFHVDFNNPDDLKKIESILSSNEYKHLRTVDRI
jgi:hypothetical protein